VKIERIEKGNNPGCWGVPSIENLLPLPVCPYAITVPLPP